MELTKKQNRQITKFGFYGFFKNLRFFDPVLLIYLASFNLSAFHIGLLYSIREAMIYIFEIPSGVIADQYGKKTELIICFLFYIASFIIFAIGHTFIFFAIAMVLFGLGEAFRSGTHKSMIMHYLDINDMADQKSKTYGKTRSYSMIGSMISSLFTIYLVIALPGLRFLFFLAIIPYLLDILLIASYPNVLNDRKQAKFEWGHFFREGVSSVKYALKDKKMRSLLISSSSYQAGFKILKDFIQLILVSMPITLLLFSGYSADDHVQIYSAIMYAVIFLISAITSRYAYLLLKYLNHNLLTKLMWLTSGAATILIGVFSENIFIVFVGFIFLYIFLNIRKPLMVEMIGDASDKNKRASVLSIESQLTSLLIIIFAPLLGHLSDITSYGFMFMVVGLIMVLVFIVSILRPKRKETLDLN